MRVPSPSYRFLFFAMTLVAVAATSLAIWDVRKLEAAKRENELLTRANDFANTYAAYRDQDYDFTVTNYGFTYQGRTGTVIDDCVIKNGTWEKHVLFFLSDYARAANIADRAFIDVGANTGIHSLYMATRMKEVHAIEPYPPVLKRLHGNIAANKFANVKVHEIGLGDKEDTIPFFAADDDNHGNGTFRAEAQNKPFGHLRIVAGDEYLKAVPMAPVGLIKLDIEGFEEFALKGLKQTLEKHRPAMFFEISNKPRGTIASFEQMKSLFPADYEFLIFVEDDLCYLNGHYDLTEFTPELAAEFFSGKDPHRNFVAVPKEKASVVPRHRGPK